MRNPERIAPMMNDIAYLWQENFPDWRFAQLIMNFIGWLGRDPFYLEDAELMGEFRNFIDEMKNGRK